jgi:hypothetical protein
MCDVGIIMFVERVVDGHRGRGITLDEPAASISKWGDIEA